VIQSSTLITGGACITQERDEKYIQYSFSVNVKENNHLRDLSLFAARTSVNDAVTNEENGRIEPNDWMTVNN
jgi:hypothetical protein